MEGVIVSDMEILRGGKSFTVETLEQLYSPDRRLFLLLGTDMVLTFDRWYRFEDILKMCYPVYVRREEDPILGARVVAKITEYYEKYGVMFRRIVTDPITLSSTQIREACAVQADISRMVCPKVEQYIKENGLYV
jgi:nicotinate-nucleotide adenylyltransferase